MDYTVLFQQSDTGALEPMGHFEAIKPEFYTLADVRQKLGVSQATLFRWICKGSFPKPMKFGQKNMWRVATIEEWITEQEQAVA
jgi:predicted DNA-binding transcriptional regulator AlpA